MSRRIEKENSSQKILITAFECLSNRGYANVSMRDIADEAGVALSQITYYYKNKEKLFTEVINVMIHQYLHEIEERLKSAPDTREKISSLIKFFNDLIIDRPNLLKLFIDFTAQALWLPSFREQVDSLFNSLVDMIEKNIMRDDTKVDTWAHEFSSKSIARLILGAFYGTSIQIMLASDNDKQNAFESLSLMESFIH